MCRFGVIGSVNRDVIVSAAGRTHCDLGGSLYTVMALASLVPAATVVPMARIGVDVLPAVRALLACCPQVSMAGFRMEAAVNYACRLEYRSDGSKREILTGSLVPLSRADLWEGVLELDALLVNFITGRELRLEALQCLRRAFRGPIAMDLHSLLLRSLPDGTRVAEAPADWREWAALADALQMNASEAALLAEAEGPLDENRLAALARRLLELGPRWVAITRGAAGALAVEAGAPGPVTAPALAVPAAVDPTGCGDVFLAALGAGLLARAPLAAVLRAACRAAGQASQWRGPAALRRLEPLALA